MREASYLTNLGSSHRDKPIMKKSQALITMKLTLKPEHQKLIEAKLNTGHYANPDEIIAEALQLLSKRDQYQQWVEDIGQKIDIAAEQLDRGEGIDGETAIAQLKARLQKNCEA
jgi:antitoxin ParD1/3/4